MTNGKNKVQHKVYIKYSRSLAEKQTSKNFVSSRPNFKILLVNSATLFSNVIFVHTFTPVFQKELSWSLISKMGKFGNPNKNTKMVKKKSKLFLL